MVKTTGSPLRVQGPLLTHKASELLDSMAPVQLSGLACRPLLISSAKAGSSQALKEKLRTVPAGPQNLTRA